MQKSPLISVLMPVYNGELYLKESILSILNQTYTNFELIIVDDGSIDQSEEIIRQFSKIDKRISYFKNEKNMGLPYTRNKTVNLARGEYLAIMDSDDIAVSDRLEKQVNFLENHPNIVVVGTDYEVFQGWFVKKNKRDNYTFIPEIELLFGSIVCNPSAMIRKDFLGKNNISYDLKCKIAQDYKLWTDIAINKGEFGHINEILLRYRSGHENITKRSNEKYSMRKEVISYILESYLTAMGYSLSKKQINIFVKFFGDTSYKEHFYEDDIKVLFDIFEKMVNYIEDDVKGYFKKLYSHKLKNAVLLNHNLSVNQKIRYLKLLKQKGFYIDNITKDTFKRSIYRLGYFLMQSFK